MIIHLDADAFFASVEQAADTRLRGRPIAVGGAKRGVVASASYEARKLGIYSTMPTAKARKMCPKLIIIPGDYDKYETFSRLMFSFAYDHTPKVEVASIDEGYFDLSGNRHHTAKEVATIIRKAIQSSLKITVSEGIASNKLVAAIASKIQKPKAFIEVLEGEEKAFLAPLASKWLPGVGPKLAQTLHQAGLTRIGQIACLRPQDLSLLAGNLAASLCEFSRGIDTRLVIPDPPEAKSYSAQETFESDITDEDWILAKLRSMADRLLAKIRADGKSIRTVAIFLRYNDFDECRRSESLMEPSDLETDIYPLVQTLLRRAWERRVSLRQVGVKLSGLYNGVFQEQLRFLDTEPASADRRRLAGVIDTLRGKYGASACMRGHDLFLQQYKVAKPAVPQILIATQKKEWIPLSFKSGYSFLNSLLKPEQIVACAAAAGHPAVAMTDPNLHGAIEFYQAAKEAGIKAIIGAEITIDAQRMCAYVQDKNGYQNLCALLSLPVISRAAFQDCSSGLLIRPAEHQQAIRYASRSEKPMYQVLSSIRTLSLLNHRAADKSLADYHYPLAPLDCNTKDSLHIADSCGFEFELGELQFPHFYPPDGSAPSAFLRRLTLAGAKKKYGTPSTEILAQINEELSMIAEVGYEEYFLITWDILWNDCHPQGIDWITRGSAADSLVCYCLGISDVCPIRFELYFRRFLNRDRMLLNKLPDIDLDFPHDRKDDVIDLIFKKYGSHAAIVGGFNTFKGRSAFADIAKVMGVSEIQVRRMTEHIPWVEASRMEDAVAQSQECKGEGWAEDPYKTALRLASRLDGFPRHPKMHPCGIVIARDPIATLTPLFAANKGYPTTHFDMHGVEAIGLVKMDILAQGGLSVIRDTKKLLAARGITIPSLKPWEDAEIWDMIAQGGARGVHHIESPAMLNLAKMVAVHTIDDLIAIVSVIRPGAGNNLKKQSFARRAQGVEVVDYTHASLESVLRTTYGVVAYEEHILQICESFAGLSGGRADILRRALSKHQGEKIKEMGREFMLSAKALGRTTEEITSVWALIIGFQGYAFCRAHSTAYGVEAYEAAHMKRYYPVEFLSCVLSHGKGFYNRLVYSIECRRLGIGFLLPDINNPQESFHPIGQNIATPITVIKGIRQETLTRWRAERPFTSIKDFTTRCHPNKEEMTSLIRVGAFDRFGHSRTAQYWQYANAKTATSAQGQPTLFKEADHTALPNIPLEEPSYLEHLRAENELLGFTVSGHPLDQYPEIAWDTYCPLQAVGKYIQQQVTVAGLIITERIHSQNDGNLMKFISICDYEEILECELFSETYQRYGGMTRRHPVVELTGIITPLDNGNGYSILVQAVNEPRKTAPP